MDLTIRWTINTTQVVLVLIFSMVTQGHGLSSKRQVPPTFLDIGKRNITVHKGELAVLGCKIRNLGPKQVAWRKLPMYYPLTVGTITFATDEDISVEHNILNNDISEWNLVIKRAKTSHTGTYECQISAKRIYTHHVYLNVLDQPAIPEKVPKDPKKRRGGTDTKTEVGEQTGRNSCSHMEYLVSNSLMLFIIFLTLR